MGLRTAARWLCHAITSSKERPYILLELSQLEAFVAEAIEDRDILELFAILDELKYRIFSRRRRDQLVTRIAAVLGEYEGILLSPKAGHAAIASAKRKYEVNLGLRYQEQQRLNRDERERQSKRLAEEQLRRDREKREAERKAKEAADEQARQEAEASARREEEEKREAERKAKEAADEQARQEAEASARREEEEKREAERKAKEAAAAVVLEKQDKAKPLKKIEEPEPTSTDIHEVDHVWIEKLDQYVWLEHDERLRIISEIAKSDRSIEDWIEELLHQQETDSCVEDVGFHSPELEWLQDIDFAPSRPEKHVAEGTTSQQVQRERSNVDPNEPRNLGATQQDEESISPKNPSKSASSRQCESTEFQEQERSFPFVYQTKDDILRITNCHPSALKKAAKELKCKAPFSLVDADRLAFALTGDASIRRVYLRRLEELNSLKKSADSNKSTSGNH